MTIKRAILTLLTFLVVLKLGLSLVESFNQPQSQSRLELYQTDLILQASEYQSDVVASLVGNDPYSAAEKQYEQALTDLRETSNLLSEDPNQALAGSRSALKQAQLNLAQVSTSLKLNLGVLASHQGKTAEAVEIWSDLKPPVASHLVGLWQQQPQVDPNLETELQTDLKGWFRYQSLKKLYQVENRSSDLTDLEQQEQEAANQAILKLVAIAGLPFISGALGLLVLLGLLLQWWKQKDQAVLAINNTPRWEVPWDGETTWQVVIVGFFFISQYILPLLFSLTGFDPSQSSLRAKALYVLASYSAMAVVGLLVLNFSIRSFRPFPADWFKWNWRSNWLLWGVGGYLVALPLVLIVSLINQQIWQGQGGGNPLILLALQSQDRIALAIFFVTAAVAAPLFEETIFRGFLLPSLTRYFPVWGAVVVSSLIFAIAHLSLAEVLPLTVLGLILGFVYSRSRNLLASVLLHSLWNSGTLLSLFILGSQ